MGARIAPGGGLDAGSVTGIMELSRPDGWMVGEGGPTAPQKQCVQTTEWCDGKKIAQRGRQVLR